MTRGTYTLLDIHGNVLKSGDSDFTGRNASDIFVWVQTAKDRPFTITGWHTHTMLRNGDGLGGSGSTFLSEPPYGGNYEHQDEALREHEKIVALIREKLSKREPLVIREVEMPGEYQ